MQVFKVSVAIFDQDARRLPGGTESGKSFSARTVMSCSDSPKHRRRAPSRIPTWGVRMPVSHPHRPENRLWSLFGQQQNGN